MYATYRVLRYCSILELKHTAENRCLDTGNNADKHTVASVCITTSLPVCVSLWTLCTRPHKAGCIQGITLL